MENTLDNQLGLNAERYYSNSYPLYFGFVGQGYNAAGLAATPNLALSAAAPKSMAGAKPGAIAQSPAPAKSLAGIKPGAVTPVAKPAPSIASSAQIASTPAKASIVSPAVMPSIATSMINTATAPIQQPPFGALNSGPGPISNVSKTTVNTTANKTAASSTGYTAAKPTPDPSPILLNDTPPVGYKPIGGISKTTTNTAPPKPASSSVPQLPDSITTQNCPPGSFLSNGACTTVPAGPTTQINNVPIGDATLGVNPFDIPGAVPQAGGGGGGGAPDAGADTGEVPADDSTPMNPILKYGLWAAGAFLVYTFFIKK